MLCRTLNSFKSSETSPSPSFVAFAVQMMESISSSDLLRKIQTQPTCVDDLLQSLLMLVEKDLQKSIESFVQDLETQSGTTLAADPSIPTKLTEFFEALTRLSLTTKLSEQRPEGVSPEDHFNSQLAYLTRLSKQTLASSQTILEQWTKILQAASTSNDDEEMKRLADAFTSSMTGSYASNLATFLVFTLNIFILDNVSLGLTIDSTELKGLALFLTQIGSVYDRVYSALNPLMNDTEFVSSTVSTTIVDRASYLTNMTKVHHSGFSPIQTDNVLQLCSRNSTGTSNSITFNNPVQKAESFVATFEIFVGIGARADAIWFFCGGNSAPVIEDHAGTVNAFLVAFDVFSGNPGGAGRSGPGIYLFNQEGTPVKSAPYSYAGGVWKNVAVKYTASATRTWVVEYDGVEVIAHDEPHFAEWANNSGNLWGIGARTGGECADFSVKNVHLETTQTLQTHKVIDTEYCGSWLKGFSGESLSLQHFLTVQLIGATGSVNAQDRANGLRAAADCFSQMQSVGEKTNILMTVSRAIHHGSDAHFLSGLSGSSTSDLQALENEWARLSLCVVAACNEWLSLIDENSITGKTFIRALMAGVSMLTLDFRPSDAKFLKDVGLVEFISRLAQCDCFPLRSAALKCAEILLHRCVTQDQNMQTKQTESHSFLMSSVLTILGNQLERAVSSSVSLADSLNSSIDVLTKKGGKWLLRNTVICDPTEPGFVCSEEGMTFNHSFSAWVWRPKGTNSGSIVVNSGPDVTDIAIKEVPSCRSWSSVSLSLQDGLLVFVAADGLTSDGFKLVGSQELREEVWSHVSYVVSLQDKEVQLYLDGEACGSKELPHLMLNPHLMSYTEDQIIQTNHSYDSNMRQYWTVDVPNAVKYTVTCDPRSQTERNYDYLVFYKGVGPRSEVIGEPKYTGTLFPGVGSCPKLEIEGPFEMYFYSDGSGSDWGFAATITAHVIAPRDSTESTSSTILNKNNWFIGQPPAYASTSLSALCAVSNACLFDLRESDCETSIVFPQCAGALWGLGSNHIKPITAFGPCNKVETVSILALLSRISKSLLKEHSFGHDQLLSDDILPPLITLSFQSSSTAIRLAATRVMSLILRHSSVLAVDTHFFSLGLSSSTPSVSLGTGAVFDASVRRLGYLLNPLNHTNKISESPLAFVEASQCRMMIDAVCHAGGEWESCVSASLDRRLSSALDTLQELVCLSESDLKGFESSPETLDTLKRDDVNDLIGLLAIFGERFTAFLPGGRVKYTAKNSAMAEPYTILSYSKGCSLGSKFGIVPMSSGPQVHSVPISQLTPLNREESLSPEMQRMIKSKAEPLLDLLSRIVSTNTSTHSLQDLIPSVLVLRLVKSLGIETGMVMSSLSHEEELMVGLCKMLWPHLLREIVESKIQASTSLHLQPTSDETLLASLMQSVKNSSSFFTASYSSSTPPSETTLDTLQRIVSLLGHQCLGLPKAQQEPATETNGPLPNSITQALNFAASSPAIASSSTNTTSASFFDAALNKPTVLKLASPIDVSLMSQLQRFISDRADKLLLRVLMNGLRVESIPEDPEQKALMLGELYLLLKVAGFDSSKPISMSAAISNALSNTSDESGSQSPLLTAVATIATGLMNQISDSLEDQTRISKMISTQETSVHNLDTYTQPSLKMVLSLYNRLLEVDSGHFILSYNGGSLLEGFSICCRLLNSSVLNPAAMKSIADSISQTFTSMDQIRQRSDSKTSDCLPASSLAPLRSVGELIVNLARRVALAKHKGPSGSPSDSYMAVLQAAVLASENLGLEIFEDPDLRPIVLNTVLTVESVHPYLPATQEFTEVNVPGAVSYSISFDPRSSTDGEGDYVKFYQDQSQSTVWGEEKYFGGKNESTKNFPGVDGLPPLVINAPHFTVFFNSAHGSSKDWGFGLTITVTYSPELVSEAQDESKVPRTLMIDEPKPLLVSSFILESQHNYADNMDLLLPVTCPGATGFNIVFDNQTCTEANYDYIHLYKDQAKNYYWGSKYTGGRNSSTKNYPGTEGREALFIPASNFYFFFHSDGSNNDWGWKAYVTPRYPDTIIEDQTARDVNVLLRTHRACSRIQNQSANLTSWDDELINYLGSMVKGGSQGISGLRLEDIVDGDSSFDEHRSTLLSTLISQELDTDCSSSIAVSQVAKISPALRARFEFLKKFNEDVSKGMGMIDLAQAQDSWSLANRLVSNRRYVFSSVKNTLDQRAITLGSGSNEFK